MKKQLLLAALLLPFWAKAQFAKFPTPGLEYGQIYVPNVFDGPIPWVNSMNFYRDTFICGEAWSWFEPYGYLIKADSGKYFNLQNPANCSGKVLMYDFNLILGQTIDLADLGTLQVKQKGFFMLNNGESRLKLSLGYVGNPNIYFTWVDGVGDIDRSFFRWTDFEGGHEQLICLRDSANGVFYTNPANPLDCDSLLCPRPHAYFSRDCENRTFYFHNQSNNADGYNWDFGDGEVSDEANPVHEYQSGGCFKVVLSAKSGCLPGQSFNYFEFINVDAPHFWKKNAEQPPSTYRVQMLDSLNGWALGPATVWKTHDGWATADSVSYPGNWRRTIDLQFSDMEHGIISVQTQDPTYPYGMDILWTDNGSDFSLQIVKDKIAFTAIERINDSTAVVAQQYNYLYLTKNHGKDWTHLTFFNSSLALVEDFQKIGGDTVYLVGRNQNTPAFQGFIFGKTTDGTDWSFKPLPINAGGTNSMSFINAQEGWVAGFGGFILHTKNAGEDWETLPTDPFGIWQVSFLDSLHGWGIGWGVFWTQDGGHHWSQQACTLLNEPLTELNAFSPTQAYLAAKQGLMEFSAQPDTVRTCPTVVETVNLFEKKPQFSISPNPSSDEVTLQLPEGFFEKPTLLRVFDVFGKLVFDEKITSPNARLNVENWAAGVYFFEIQQPDGRKCAARFVKSRGF